MLITVAGLAAAAPIIGAGIGAVSGLGAAKINSNAANDAAQIQAQTAQKALDEKARLFAIEQAQRKPYLDASTAALGRLSAQSGNIGPMALPGPYQAPQNPYAPRTMATPRTPSPMMGMAPQQGTAPQTATPPMNTPAGMVTVQDPQSGRQAHIPQEQLQTALSRGLKQVG